MLIIRGGINSKKRELCPTALALSAFYYNKNKHADTYIMYLHAYSTRDTRESAHCLWFVGHIPWIVKTWKRHGIRCKNPAGRNAHIFLKRIFHLHFHQKSKGMIFLIYYFSRQEGLSASSDCPSFSFIGSIMFIPSLMHAWNLRSQ